MAYQGKPVWFELGTSDVDGAADFYGKVLGWSVGGSQMPDMDYRLASRDGQMVAGLTTQDRQPPGTPPNWLVYVASDDLDADVAKLTAAGGTVIAGPDAVPGTGRFAVAADPQGTVFGLLQPDPMPDVQPDDGAWNQQKPGFGNWLELMSTDPKAGLAFYGQLFGWQPTQGMDMGEMGTYQLFSWRGADIGGAMGLGAAPQPAWLAYFGTESVRTAIDTISGAGGKVLHGPFEVPGGAQIAVATDPQGAWFAVVGPLDAA